MRYLPYPLSRSFWHFPNWILKSDFLWIKIVFFVFRGFGGALFLLLPPRNKIHVNHFNSDSLFIWKRSWANNPWRNLPGPVGSWWLGFMVDWHWGTLVHYILETIVNQTVHELQKYTKYAFVPFRKDKRNSDAPLSYTARGEGTIMKIRLIWPF